MVSPGHNNDLVTSWRVRASASLVFTNLFPEYTCISGKGHILKCNLIFFSIFPAIPEAEHSKVSLLLADIDPSLSSMNPASILLIARAGSYLYGLSTANSDADYIIVYVEPTSVRQVIGLLECAVWTHWGLCEKGLCLFWNLLVPQTRVFWKKIVQYYGCWCPGSWYRKRYRNMYRFYTIYSIILELLLEYFR